MKQMLLLLTVSVKLAYDCLDERCPGRNEAPTHRHTASGVFLTSKAPNRTHVTVTVTRYHYNRYRTAAILSRRKLWTPSSQVKSSSQSYEHFAKYFNNQGTPKRNSSTIQIYFNESPTRRAHSKTLISVLVLEREVLITSHKCQSINSINLCKKYHTLRSARCHHAN